MAIKDDIEIVIISDNNSHDYCTCCMCQYDDHIIKWICFALFLFILIIGLIIILNI